MRADVIFRHTVNLRRKRLPATSGVEKQGLREQKHLGQGHLDTDCLALGAHPAWPITQCLPGRWPEVLLGIWGAISLRTSCVPISTAGLGLKCFYIGSCQSDFPARCHSLPPDPVPHPSSLPQQLHCCDERDGQSLTAGPWLSSSSPPQGIPHFPGSTFP